MVTTIGFLTVDIIVVIVINLLRRVTMFREGVVSIIVHRLSSEFKNKSVRTNRAWCYGIEHYQFIQFVAVRITIRKANSEIFTFLVLSSVAHLRGGRKGQMPRAAKYSNFYY
jgi:hypothetical protein